MTVNPHPVRPASSLPTPERRVVDLARLAPSIHNSQPWSWRRRGAGRLELWADRTRALPVADPDGRQLMISCGAALHHAVLAAKACGCEADVERQPDPGRPDLLAQLALRPGSPWPQARTQLAAMTERRTDRRRFTAWPVPAGTLSSLALAAAGWGADARPLVRPAVRARVETLLEEARLAAAADPRDVAETRTWIDRSQSDGIPAGALPATRGGPGEHPHRFEAVTHADAEPAALSDAHLASSDGLIVIATEGDRQRDWLRAGEALSALWLHATTTGLSVVPLSQGIEHAPCRDVLRVDLSLRRPTPQLLLRIGWQQIGRGSLPRTPRRPLTEVLRTVL